jgi:uncharacterized metal-binding protein YceD (DUF177 family)
VNYLKEFVINFGNLKPGIHKYEFEIGEKFFEQFEYSLVKHGSLQVILDLEKQKETLMLFHFKINGLIVLQCDRCLDNYSFPLNTEEQLIVKLQEAPKETDDDEIIFLPVETYQIDISSYIYEYINLALPLKSVCNLGAKECNPEMLAVLEKMNTPPKADDNTDPRWEGLKGLN